MLTNRNCMIKNCIMHSICIGWPKCHASKITKSKSVMCHLAPRLRLAVGLVNWEFEPHITPGLSHQQTFHSSWSLFRPTSTGIPHKQWELFTELAYITSWHTALLQKRQGNCSQYYGSSINASYPGFWIALLKDEINHGNEMTQSSL